MGSVCFYYFQSASQIGTLEALIGRKSAILDVDWSRIGTLETLIGSRAVCKVRLCPSLKVSHGKQILKYELWFWLVRSVRSTSTMNCIAKHKRPDSQKLEMRRRGVNFKVCKEQRYVYLIFAFFVFDLISMWCKKRFRKSHFHSETKSYSLERLCY